MAGRGIARPAGEQAAGQEAVGASIEGSMPAPPVQDAAMPRGRAGLMCANPRCWYLVHVNPAFGGYCCKKCHWRQATQSKSKKHGIKCQQAQAPEGAPRAPEVPPDGALEVAEKDGGAAAVSWSSSLPQAASSPQPVANQGSWHQATGSSVHGCLPKRVSVNAPSCRDVRIRGFTAHSLFNGLPATIEAELPDGRYNLMLADGTLLRYVKPEHFERVDQVNGVDVS